MSTAVLSPSTRPSAPPPTARWPRPLQWTAYEFHRLGDLGLLPGRSIILVEGEFWEMPPPGPPHDMAILLLNALLGACFPAGFTVRAQMSLVLGRTTDPLPDLVVVPGSPRDYPQKPTTAVLVVEIADSSLDYDTVDKASLYASAGINDYWVVDLVNRQVIVFRDPVPDPTRRFGAGYATVTTHAAGQSVSPLAAPAATIAVADLLP